MSAEIIPFKPKGSGSLNLEEIFSLDAEDAFGAYTRAMYAIDKLNPLDYDLQERYIREIISCYHVLTRQPLPEFLMQIYGNDEDDQLVFYMKEVIKTQYSKWLNKNQTPLFYIIPAIFTAMFFTKDNPNLQLAVASLLPPVAISAWYVRFGTQKHPQSVVFSEQRSMLQTLYAYLIDTHPHLRDKYSPAL